MLKLDVFVYSLITTTFASKRFQLQLLNTLITNGIHDKMHKVVVIVKLTY